MTECRSSKLPRNIDALCAVLEEKLDNGCAHMHATDVRLNMLQEEIRAIKAADGMQNERLERIEKNTDDIVMIFRAGDGTLKTARWFGKLLIWIGSLASAIYAIYCAIMNWPQRGL